MNRFVAGQPVTWLHAPRGGYGYVWSVPAYVVTVGPRRIGIAARTKNYEWKPRWVNPENLVA